MPTEIKNERRAFLLQEIRVTRDQNTNKTTLRGYAAVFDKLSLDLGGFREKIERGAFARALKEKQDVRALVNHDSNQVIGRSIAGTLRMKEDREGLAVEIDLPDTTVGRDVAISVERGDMDQMSFAFRTIKDQWEHSKDQETIRTLLDVDINDVSIVTYPAYPDTSIALRALDQWKETQKTDEPDPAIDIDLRRRRLDLEERI